ncbi:MAG: extracellular solute-binding protein [Clostridiales bacterium]|jgi:putative aldouronate transport system substrate-binding protein|nr:extracellular solute-binding protein [Clostridiales bacterium]
MNTRIIKALLLALALTLGLGACGAPKEAGQPAGSEGVSASGLEPIRFSIFSPDAHRKIPPDDAPIVQQVFDSTGVMFDWIIPPAEARERLNIMLATDDLPDLITFWDATMQKQFIEAGKLLDVEPLMKEYAPQTYEVNYASFRDRIRDADGKMYFLPGGYEFGDAADSLGFPETSTAYSARTGLLEELGWYNPDSLDAIYELLKISKERQPEMSPLALALGPEGHLWAMNGLGAGAYGLTYTGTGDVHGILLYNGQVEFFSDVPELKEWYAYLNKIHREGLLDIESPVMSADMLKEKLVAGKIFSWFGEGWEPGSEFISYMESIGSDEQCDWYFHPRANDSVTKTTYAQYQKGLHTTGVTVTKNCKDPARFFQFFEWINTEEGWLKSHGIIDWDFTGENTMENTEGYDFVVLNDVPEVRPGMKRLVASEWMGNSWNDDENWWWNRGLENFGAFKYLEGNHPNGKYDYVGDRDVGMWWDENTKRIYGAYGMTGLNYWEIMTATGSDNTVIHSLVIEPGTDEAIASVAMDEYLRTQLPRVIVANTESEFETLWAEMESQLTALGKDEFMAKKRELYQQRIEAWNLD